MPSSYSGRPTSSAEMLLRSFGLRPGRPFGGLLGAADVERLLAEHGVRFGGGAGHVYNPTVTLWALLGQCLAAAKDCASAVARVVALHVALYLDPCSPCTGSYCLARARLPADLLRDLCDLLGERLEDAAPAARRWRGRRCVYADGTTLSAPDTPASQGAYPQSKAQKPGLGFPLIRLVVLTALASGACLGAAHSPWRGKGNGESSLLRHLLGVLRPGDVLVADRAYGCYPLIALLASRGIDVCFRVQQTASALSARERGTKVGEDDWAVEWSLRQRPDWLDEEAAASLPGSLRLREVHTRVEKKGWRTKHAVLVTTLTDRELFPAADLRELYRRRWDAETDIGLLKTHMGAAVLRGKTPDMLHREIRGHLLAYNLVRRLQAEAALSRGLAVRELSFAAALKPLRENAVAPASYEDARHDALLDQAVRAAGSARVADRPDRFEPRRLKRRPKNCKLMTKPRKEAREEVAAGSEANQPKTWRKRKKKAPPPAAES